MGSPLRMIGEDGKTYSHFKYDEFGRPESAEKFDQNWSGPDNVLGYTGYQYDYEAGLYYAQARYYMPDVGRFTQEDTYAGRISEPGTLNVYAYCHNDPINYIDPTGHMRAGYFDNKGVYHADPDAEEFGSDSITYKALLDLSDSWNNGSEYMRQDISHLSDSIRERARVLGNEIIYLRYKAYSKLLGTLNNTERVLAISDPFMARDIKSCRDYAEEKAKEIFKFDPVPDNTNANAFKHSYWNALMVKKVGVENAMLFANAHEYGYKGNLTMSRLSTEMDLFNNYVGRYQGSIFINKTEDELANIILNRIKEGGLLRNVVNGVQQKKNVNTNCDLE